MSSAEQNSPPASDQQVLSHFVYRKIRENGGAVALSTILYSVSDVADLTQEDARDLIDTGETAGIYTISRDQHNEKQIQSVDPVGPEPPVIGERFGDLDHTGADFVTMDGVDATIETALHDGGYESFEALAEADPSTVADAINDELDTQAEPADFDQLTGLTDSEITALQDEGIVTKRDLVQADPQAVEANTQSATLLAAKVKQAQRQVESDVHIYDEREVQQFISEAQQSIPAGNEIAATQIQRHEARKSELGHAGAVVREVEEQTETVGEPLAVVDSSLDPGDPEANYVSDIGFNADDPVNTGFPVLDDIGYDLVPKPDTHPDAGHSALPTDEDGAVVPPTVPLERDLQMPIDELVAKKLGRNVPVRIVGPRGSGKNYLMKYLCYKTNRGYRSLDVDKATMPQDLFGPIAPDEDGKLEPKNAEVKQGLLNGDVIVLNEFPVMQAGAAMSLHQLLNENKIVIKSHGQEIEPHPQARLVITMNPPTREYRDSEPMNSATRGRFRSFWQGYPDTVEDEVRALAQQVNTGRTVVDEQTLEKIVEFAHRTRKDQFTNWPTLSTRNLTIVCEHIADGASPKAATKNVLRMVAEPNQHPGDAFDSLGEVL
ncbi:AAA family ATPase [Halosimplex pelagicum]|uniref:AAA family ATPase n=1 Tax=Halosimplex pelagicum TaxID=869886 RepID=A0A7D5PB23_9EURY|nr:AAA family ATPase [Halosimplex pelagicum]QLH82125.1 AAA family ATPase [Halosimplex pelagicum]